MAPKFLSEVKFRLDCMKINPLIRDGVSVSTSQSRDGLQMYQCLVSVSSRILRASVFIPYQTKWWTSWGLWSGLISVSRVEVSGPNLLLAASICFKLGSNIPASRIDCFLVESALASVTVHHLVGQESAHQSGAVLAHRSHGLGQAVDSRGKLSCFGACHYAKCSCQFLAAPLYPSWPIWKQRALIDDRAPSVNDIPLDIISLVSIVLLLEVWSA